MYDEYPLRAGDFEVFDEVEDSMLRINGAIGINLVPGPGTAAEALRDELERGDTIGLLRHRTLDDPDDEYRYTFTVKRIDFRHFKVTEATLRAVVAGWLKRHRPYLAIEPEDVHISAIEEGDVDYNPIVYYVIEKPL